MLYVIQLKLQLLYIQSYFNAINLGHVHLNVHTRDPGLAAVVLVLVLNPIQVYVLTIKGQTQESFKITGKK